MSDLISRQDAIEAVVCHIWHMPNEAYRQFNCENIVREVVEDAIKRLPSAEAVTHGRLIDADVLSEKLCETTIFIKDGEVFQRMINDAPTVSAEAVQVVRCKDCKWYRHIGCAIEIKDDSDRPKPDDFCSFGEKRGDADEQQTNGI